MKKESIFRHNTILYDKLMQFVKHRENEEYKEIVSLSEKIDSIAEYEVFKKHVLKIKKHIIQNKLFMQHGYGADAYLYGQLQNLIQYAGYNCTSFSLPFIEHGINWYEQIPDGLQEEFYHAYIFQGPYRLRPMKTCKKQIPAFCIGPYILYAKPYYDQIKFDRLKERLGKTLLVFPFHCYEASQANYSEKEFVDQIMKNYAINFDSVLVCAYWNDVFDNIYNLFVEKGAQIVSAGFRGDPLFLSRLRTIISLSDVTIGNNLGTHIGYCMALKKPHIITGGQLELIEPVKAITAAEQNIYDETLKSFRYAFSSQSVDENQMCLQEKLFRKFWGGFGFHKTPEEMKAIIMLGEEISKAIKGNPARTGKCVNTLLEIYRTSSLPFDQVKYHELLKSL